MIPSLTPTTPLFPDEKVLNSFHAERGVYIRDHIIMAILFGIGAMVVLYFMDEVWWVGFPAALGAIAVRAFYLASDDLKTRWDLTDRRLMGPQDRVAWLKDIKQINRFGSAIQIVTTKGDKHLIKYLSDRSFVLQQIEAAQRGEIG